MGEVNECSRIVILLKKKKGKKKEGKKIVRQKKMRWKRKKKDDGRDQWLYIYTISESNYREREIHYYESRDNER